jgi:hypothetical protein
VTVIHHDDRFASATPDQVWLRVAGESGWIVLTADQRIRYRENEKRALMESGVAAFVLSSGNMTGPEMAKLCVAVIPRMERMIQKRKPPFIVQVTRSGALVPLT